MTISRWIIFRMMNVSDKSYRENQNTHFVFSSFFFPRKSCRLWDNVEKCDGDRETAIWRLVACWICKATRAQAHASARESTTHARTHTHAITNTHTHTHTQICNTVLPLKQWFRERALMLRYSFIACLVLSCLYRISVVFRIAVLFCNNHIYLIYCLVFHRMWGADNVSSPVFPPPPPPHTHPEPRRDIIELVTASQNKHQRQLPVLLSICMCCFRTPTN
jgi:hypothetical protein